MFFNNEKNACLVRWCFIVGLPLGSLQPDYHTGLGVEYDQATLSPQQVLSFASSSKRNTVVVLSTFVGYNWNGAIQ